MDLKRTQTHSYTQEKTHQPWTLHVIKKTAFSDKLCSISSKLTHAPTCHLQMKLGIKNGLDCHIGLPQ